ncbi:MAG: VTT domain-containing protein [Campylobacteraceae bacterium]|nr:VTT domain-containing protein [Campylobacteraceae bacterium]
MEEVLTSLATYGYIVLFLYSFGGGMVAIIAAGVLSYKGIMNLEASIAIAAIANFTGDVMLSSIGRYNRETIMPYIKKHRRKLALSHILMKKYGDKIIIIKKFIYGLKTLIPIAVGLTKYSLLKFNILNFIAALIWALSLGYGSYYMGGYFTKIFYTLEDKPYIAPIILLFLIFLIWLYFQKATKKQNQ